MRNSTSFLLKCLALFAVVCFGMAYSAKADTWSATVTVYYVAPTDPSYNPWGLTNPGGDATSWLAITPAGDTENVSFSTSAAQGVAVGTITGSDFTIELFNPPVSEPGPIVTGTTLNPGTYVFNSCLDYFGAKTSGGNTTTTTGCAGDANYGNEPCMTGQICNAGTSPNDVVTINVAANGVVTVQSSSMEVAFSPETPSMALFGTGLLAMGFVLRRKKGWAV